MNFFFEYNKYKLKVRKTYCFRSSEINSNSVKFKEYEKTIKKKKKKTCTRQ